MIRLIAVAGFACIRPRNIRTSNNTRADFSVGWVEHASRLRLRRRQDTSAWCLRCQNHLAPSPPMSAMERTRLRSVAVTARVPASQKGCPVLLVGVLATQAGFEFGRSLGNIDCAVKGVPVRSDTYPLD